MIVVDTMVLAYSVLDTKWTDECSRLRSAESHWIAPSYAEIELLNVMWNHMRRGDFPADAAMQIYRTARAFVSELFSVKKEAAFRVAADSDCSVYDARFVALARQRGVPLITYDGRLLDKFQEAMTPLHYLGGEGAAE